MTNKDSRDNYGKIEDRLTSAGVYIVDHPWRTALKVIAVVVVLGIIFSVIGFFKGWFDAGKDIVSPTNVKEQAYQVRQDWQDLIASSQNACGAQRAAHQSGDPVLVEDPALAYAATYRRIRADYNRRQQNLFEAKLVGPSGYPDHLGVFPQETKATIPWCAITQKLVHIHAP